MKELIDAIQQGVQPFIWREKGRMYSTRTLNPVNPPAPNIFLTNTLSAIETYIRYNPNHLDRNELVIMINDPWHVMLMQKFDDHDAVDNLKLDTVYVKAYSPCYPEWKYEWRRADEFLMFLSENFLPTDDRTKIMEYVTKSRNSPAQEGEQDFRFEQAMVLKPFRTFPEIDQPVSNFVFCESVQQLDPIVKVYKVLPQDGEAWKTKAVHDLAEYFRKSDSCGDVPVIA